MGGDNTEFDWNAKIESDPFDFEDKTNNWLKDYHRKQEDAIEQTGKTFLKHLENLIRRGRGYKNSIQISQEDVYKDFIYPEAAKVAWLTYEKRNYRDTEKGAYCAQKLGLIKIDESTRPFTYKILEIDENTFELRPYQKYIIEDTCEAEGSVLIEAPTGSGKSVIANEIAKNEVEKGGKVLVVAPKIILLDQLKETFATLNPQIIHGAKDYDKEHNVFISTIQTAHKRDLGFEPTMILIDEVHFGFTGKMIKELLKDFNGRLIGLSATPYDEDGAPLQGFDTHINKYNLKYMLAGGYLVPPKCYVPLKVDLSNIGMVGSDYNQSDLDSEFNNIENIMQIVESTKQVVIERRASLIFCINIMHSEAMARAFNESGIPTKAIHSQLSKSQRDEILEDFKNGKLKALTNPVMLTTGFDHPITDTVILARATKSQNLYRQMVGRALRLNENKKDAVILDCSNVIENLGLPTEDIQEKLSGITKSKQVCEECESEKLYRKIKRNRAYLVCSDCGHSKAIEERGYECERCKLVHTHKANFITNNGALFLICSDCGHHTCVYEEASKEELLEIFDNTYIRELQKQVTLKYCEYLIDKYATSFLFKKDVVKHMEALQKFITQEPELFVRASERNLSAYCIQKINNQYEWKFSYGKDWRMFDVGLEEEFINNNLSALHDSLKASNHTSQTIEILKNIYNEKEKEFIDEEDLQNLFEDIRCSKLKGIDKMCSKRLKDLYFSDKDLKEIFGFVNLMESVIES